MSLKQNGSFPRPEVVGRLPALSDQPLAIAGRCSLIGHPQVEAGGSFFVGGWGASSVRGPHKALRILMLLAFKFPCAEFPLHFLMSESAPPHDMSCPLPHRPVGQP